MDIVIGLALFWLGAIFGSFAGAVAWRLHQKQDFVRGRSACEHCHHQLAPLDLIPIISWMFLRGRCRYCRASIGVSMVVGEVALATAFVVSYYAWPLGFAGVAQWLLFFLWLLILVLFTILSIYDIKWTLLPDSVMYVLFAMACLFFVGHSVLTGLSIQSATLEMMYSLIPISGVYGLLYFVSHGKWIGFGDVKLGISLGLILGWRQALLALVLANAFGFLYVLPGLLMKKLDYTARVPFGPFLMLATFVAFLYGQYIITAYLDYVLF